MCNQSKQLCSKLVQESPKGVIGALWCQKRLKEHECQPKHKDSHFKKFDLDHRGLCVMVFLHSIRNPKPPGIYARFIQVPHFIYMCVQCWCFKHGMCKNILIFKNVNFCLFVSFRASCSQGPAWFQKYSTNTQWRGSWWINTWFHIRTGEIWYLNLCLPL